MGCRRLFIIGALLGALYFLCTLVIDFALSGWQYSRETSGLAAAWLNLPASMLLQSNFIPWHLKTSTPFQLTLMAVVDAAIAGTLSVLSYLVVRKQRLTGKWKYRYRNRR